MNLPNYLTISRIFSVPLLIWILSTNRISSVHGEKELIASAVFTLAAITDRLDGYLARKYGLITRIGMLLDPLADKLLIASVLIVLVQFNPHIVTAWVAFVIIAREILVTDLRAVAASEGLTIQARSLGKVKMAVQIVAVIAAILDRQWGSVGFEISQFHLLLGIDLIAKLAIWASVLLAIISAGDYFTTFWSKIDRAAKSHRRPAGAVRQRAPSELSTVQQ